MSDAAALPDPAGEPAAAVLTAFANGLTDWGDDEELELRLRARTLALFEQRELASDALGAVLVLIDWMRQDVLPLVSVDLAGLPKVADLQAVKALNTALAGCERIARDRWRADGSVDEAWRVYELLRSFAAP